MVGFGIVRDSYYYNRKGIACYVYLIYNSYSYGELSINVFFMLSWDAPAEVHVLILYYDLQEIHYFIIIYL